MAHANDVRYADDGFGNLVRLNFRNMMMVLDFCYPANEDEI